MSVRDERRRQATNPVPITTGLKRVVAASMAGTVVEWYEFFLYGTAATLVFNKVFFAEGASELDAIFAAFLTYAVGFVARPVGGVVFGHFGDKYGRKKLLQFSLLLVGAATFLMGCLPTFGQVGYWAPTCWLCCGSSRASPSAASGVAPSCWSPSTALTRVAPSGPVGRRPPCPSATCSPPSCCWC